jgi:hypothetical protein
MDPAGIVIGEITNIYNGFAKEVFSKADRYLVHFPFDASYSNKLLLTYATLLIDYD